MQEYPKISSPFEREHAKPHKLMKWAWNHEELEYLSHNEWIFTEKVDGTNIRVHWDGHRVTFAGRTDAAQIPTSLTNRLVELFGGTVNEQVFEQKFGATPVTLYGEGFGAKIQKGGGNYKADGTDFILFDVLIDGFWLRRADIEDVAEAVGIEVVPIIARGSLSDGIDLVSRGLRSQWGDFYAEGLVAKPAVELLSRNGGRVITKIKHEDFFAAEQLEEAS